MHHYFEAITNRSGDSLIGYFGRVIDPATNNVVTIASDDNGTPISVVSGVENMATTDANGNLDFYVAPGTYHLDIYAPNQTSLILRIKNVAMNSTKGDKGDRGNDGDTGPADNTYATLSALIASDPLRRAASLVGDPSAPDGRFYNRGSGFVRLDDVSVTGIGAKGNFTRSASEQQGIMAAISAVRNPNDASFSGTAVIPSGTYQTTAPVILPAGFTRLRGSLGSTIWPSPGQHAFQANGAGFVQTDMRGFRIYGGVDGIRADTTGEIASITLEDISTVANTGNGFYFHAGLTSSRLSRVVTNGGTHAVHCAGGINNNNVIADSDFYNMSDDVVRIEGLTNSWQIRNLHIEGAGVANKAQHAISNPNCYHILGGWSEGSHEYLIRHLTAQTDSKAAGVIIDGLVSIGSSNFSGGFTGSKFDVGNDRIIFGSNTWVNPTTAPSRVFVYGVNRNLRLQQSRVWSRDTSVDKRVVAPARSVVDVGSRTFPLFTLTRPNSANVVNNQQAITLKCFVQFTGYDSGGNSKGAVWEVTAFVNAVGSSIASVLATVNTAVGNAGAFTLTVQQGALTANQSTVNAIIQGFNEGLPNVVNHSVDVLNVSITEADGFEVSV